MARRTPLEDILMRDPTGQRRPRQRPWLTALLTLTAILVVAVLVVEILSFVQRGPILSRSQPPAATRTVP